ncbi:S41 family peptidase [Patescibacteria group bacterium]
MVKITLKKLRKIVLTLTLCLICAGVGYWWGTHQVKIGLGNFEIGSKKVPLRKLEIVNTTVPVSKNLDFNLFWQVWSRLEEKYLEKDKLDPEKMFYGAIQGLTLSLGDPYTVFLPPEDNKQAQEDLNGSFGGVGIRLGFKDGNNLAVISPLKGSPAEAAGMRAGDLIVHLKDENKDLDEDTVGMTLPDAVKKIRGLKGTKITLTVIHENEQDSEEIEVIRDDIVVPSVEVEFLEDDTIAHLKLMRFGELTDQQWDESVDKIINKGSKLKGVILDVRGNPGGYLSGSVNLASEFLASGVIVKQENYLGEVETYSVNRKARLLDVALIVLIDKGSASASEILAGALKDHGRAKLVGENSFGKGTIQETEDLGKGAGLHITTAKWLTPNGIWVDKTGLAPDVEVKNDYDKPEEDEQLKKAIELL